MAEKTKAQTVYFLGNTMYINVTNVCTNSCVFCIRSLNGTVAGANLWLENENLSAGQVIEEIKDQLPETRDEIVFCGYGEPLIKLNIIKEVSAFLKQNFPKVPVRINTNGHASLIHKRNIVPELVGFIDGVSVSLNAENADLYAELTKCKFDKNIAFESVKEFIGECVKNGIDTTATVVSGFQNYKVDIQQCKSITESLGAKFKVREWLEEGYN